MTAVNYFPPGTFNSAHADYWSSMLIRAREAPLCDVEPDHPMNLRVCFDPSLILQKLVVRVWSSTDAWYVATKILDGLHHAELAWEHERPLVDREANLFLRLVDSARLWHMPTTIPVMGLDGTSWLVECAVRGKYHVVERWSPRDQPLSKLGAFLCRVSALREYRPDPSLVRQRVAQRDLNRAAAEREAERAAKAREEREEAIRRSNRTVKELAASLGTRAVTCPHCGEQRNDMRFVERVAPVASYFICGGCGQSFAPADSESSD